MALFKRDKGGVGTTASDLAAVVGHGSDRIEQLGHAHRERWGLGTADSWSVDQQTGVIRWSFPDGTVEAPVQTIGSFNPSAASWLWAWANQSVLPSMRRDAERVRSWAEANGHKNLTTPKVNADADIADTLAAIAVAVTDAKGFYQAPAGPAFVFLTFGPVTITASGRTETFTVG